MLTTVDPGEEGHVMSKYLVRMSLTVNGLQGLLKDGASRRREMVENMVTNVGGQLEAMYWAFGEDDVYVLVDMPGNVPVAAISLAASAAGGVRTKTTVLLTADEVDQAIRQQVDYQAPGAS